MDCHGLPWRVLDGIANPVSSSPTSLVSFVWQYVRLSTATREQHMADTLIENPILNSPFREPTRHFTFSDEGITNEIAQGRRSKWRRTTFVVQASRLPSVQAGRLHHNRPGPALQLLLHSDQDAQEKRQAARVRNGMDAGSYRGEQDSRPHPPARRDVARRRLRRRDGPSGRTREHLTAKTKTRLSPGRRK